MPANKRHFCLSILFIFSLGLVQANQFYHTQQTENNPYQLSQQYYRQSLGNQAHSQQSESGDLADQMQIVTEDDPDQITAPTESTDTQSSTINKRPKPEIPTNLIVNKAHPEQKPEAASSQPTTSMVTTTTPVISTNYQPPLHQQDHITGFQHTDNNGWNYHY